MQATAAKQPLRKRSILYGFLVDTIGSTIAFGMFGYYIAVRSEALGADVTRVSEMFCVEAISLSIGLSFTVLGACVAGIHARFREFEHGAWVGAIGFVLGIVVLAFAFLGQSVAGQALALSTTDLAAFLLQLPAGLLGGYLAYRYRTAVKEQAPHAPALEAQQLTT